MIAGDSNFAELENIPPFALPYYDFAKRFSLPINTEVRQQNIYGISNETGQEIVLRNLKDNVRPGSVLVSAGFSGLFLAHAIPNCSGVLVGDVNKAVTHLLLPAMCQIAKNVPSGDRLEFLKRLFGLEFYWKNKGFDIHAVPHPNDNIINDALHMGGTGKTIFDCVEQYQASLTTKDLFDDSALHRKNLWQMQIAAIEITKSLSSSLSTSRGENSDLSVFLNDLVFTSFQNLARRDLVKGITIDFTKPKHLYAVDELLAIQKASAGIFYVSNTLGWKAYGNAPRMTKDQMEPRSTFVPDPDDPSGNSGFKVYTKSWKQIKRARRNFYKAISDLERLNPAKFVYTEVNYGLHIADSQQKMFGVV